MFYYFGYGSNMDLTSIRAKGVEPLSSERALLEGWKLVFDVPHFFRHEGGMGNIQRTREPRDKVWGVLHHCEDDALPKLDAAEAYGFGYDRIHVEVQTDTERINAIAYVGKPSFLDRRCLPSRRYLNILINGATRADLAESYIEGLRHHPLHRKPEYPPFEPPFVPSRVFRTDTLADHSLYTAVAGWVFDMSKARPEHEFLKGLFGGKDMTLFHLKRMDSSDGTETLDDIKNDRLTDAQRRYLNEYAHEYNAEYSFVGRFEYDESDKGGQS